MCGDTKAVEAFYRGASYDGNLSPYCRSCTAVMNKRHRNAERARVDGRSRYARNPAKYCALQREMNERAKSDNPARFRAKKFFDVKRAEVAADVTVDYLEGLFRGVTHCQCCNVELTLAYEERASREYRSNPRAPSIDRVNNLGGYTRSNIAVICWRCNFRKTDLTLADLRMFIGYVSGFGEFSI